MVLRVSEARPNLIAIRMKYSDKCIDAILRTACLSGDSAALCGEQESFEDLVMESFFPVIC
jgi:hypothetical protein